MELRLKRTKSDSVSTLGELYIGNEFVCFTLEDTDRFLEEGGIKLVGATAIPRGRYQVVINESVRFKRLLPLLIDVPQFSGVRIHPGNTHKHTEGCILVGKWHDHTEYGYIVKDSRETFQKLFDRLSEAFRSRIIMTIVVE